MADGYLILIGKTKKNKLDYHDFEKLASSFFEKIRRRYDFGHSYINLTMNNGDHLYILNNKNEHSPDSSELNKLFKEYENKGLVAKILDPENLFR